MITNSQLAGAPPDSLHPDCSVAGPYFFRDDQKQGVRKIYWGKELIATVGKNLINETGFMLAKFGTFPDEMPPNKQITKI